MTREMESITVLLSDWRQGNQAALTDLMDILQDKLRELASIQFRKEQNGHTLQPTALISELYLRLNEGMEIQWQDRAHFYAVCARIMRRTLIHHARKRARSCKGDSSLTLLESEGSIMDQPVELLALDGLLERLKTINEDQYQVVTLRFFGGLTIEETALVLKTTERTVKRRWSAARLWLLGHLRASA